MLNSAATAKKGTIDRAGREKAQFHLKMYGSPILHRLARPKKGGNVIMGAPPRRETAEKGFQCTQMPTSSRDGGGSVERFSLKTERVGVHFRRQTDSSR